MGEAVSVGEGEAVDVGQGEAVNVCVGVIGCMYRVYLPPAYTPILKIGQNKCLENIQ